MTVETIRAGLSQRDATLVSLLAYGGLRPDEATGTRWDDLSERILYVHASKTEKDRVVDVLAPLAQDLAGVTGDMRPYRLRGSFVSLLLWEPDP